MRSWPTSPAKGNRKVSDWTVILLCDDTWALAERLSPTKLIPIPFGSIPVDAFHIACGRGANQTIQNEINNYRKYIVDEIVTLL